MLYVILKLYYLYNYNFFLTRSKNICEVHTMVGSQTKTAIQQRLVAQRIH